MVFMKKRKNFAETMLIRMRMVLRRKEGFGMNELLGIAAALILAAFIIIPGLKDLAENVIERLGVWWGKIANMTFTT